MVRGFKICPVYEKSTFHEGIQQTEEAMFGKKVERGFKIAVLHCEKIHVFFNLNRILET